MKPGIGIVPIQTKFLQNNFLLALGFDEGYVFGRTVRRKICNYRPYYLIDSSGDRVDISESSHNGPYRLRDVRNSDVDILYLKENTNNKFPWFLHGAIGVKPNSINVYMRFPENQEISGKFPELDPIIPTSGDDVGYFSGIQSPYEFPSDFNEIVLPPRQHVSFEFYNKESTEDGQMNHNPALNLLFAIYWFQPFDPRENANIIGRIARGEVPATIFNIGVGDRLLAYSTEYEADWKVTALSLGEAAALGGRLF